MAKCKLTPKRQKIIVELLKGGHHVRTACDGANINEDTYYSWLRRADKAKGLLAEGIEIEVDERKFVVFSENVKKAQEEAIDTLLSRVKDAASEKKHWAAAAWILERTHPSRYGRREQHVLKGDLKIEDRLRTEDILASTDSTEAYCRLLDIVANSKERPSRVKPTTKSEDVETR